MKALWLEQPQPQTELQKCMPVPSTFAEPDFNEHFCRRSGHTGLHSLLQRHQFNDAVKRH